MRCTSTRSRSRLAGLLALLLAGPLAAQQAPALRGTVRDSTGRPIPRVEVSHRGARTFSDSAGNFVLTPVPTGRISVRFVREGVLLGTVEAEVTTDTTSAVQVDVVGGVSEPRTLLGTVVDGAGLPLRDVTVDVVTAMVETRTDSLGRFRIGNLPARRHIVRVRRVGYAPTYLTADLTDSASTRARIVIREFAGQNLGLVVVRADAVPARLRGFAQRAEKKTWGTFITAEQIENRRPLRATDMLQGLAGLRVIQDGRGGSIVTGRGGCRMAVYINGFPVPQQRGASIDDLVGALDLAGIEIYNGVAGVPIELMTGAPNSCGTLGIWTK
ncbi:MAG: carboxypeptidase regulatory-like domain-containing protein [Gemmatimonadaceae bacterium]|nr:carboxypeptidase regulatory-like domain-containing protein [Gemmatimonadaceae bacterium]